HRHLHSFPTRRSSDLVTLSEDERLFEILQAGEDEGIRSFLVTRYLAGGSLTSLFDGPLLNAFRRVGDLWEHDERGILIEHRAVEDRKSTRLNSSHDQI